MQVAHRRALVPQTPPLQCCNRLSREAAYLLSALCPGVELLLAPAVACWQLTPARMRAPLDEGRCGGPMQPVLRVPCCKLGTACRRHRVAGRLASVPQHTRGLVCPFLPCTATTTKRNQKRNHKPTQGSTKLKRIECPEGTRKIGASFPVEFKSKISRIHGKILDLERSGCYHHRQGQHYIDSH